MPLPLKSGYNFNYAYLERPPHYSMTSAEAYTDFYGMSYILSGEQLSYSPDLIKLIRAGDIVFIPKDVYMRTSNISYTPFKFILLKFTEEMLSDIFELIGHQAYNELCKASIIHIRQSAHDKILSIMNEIEKEWNSYDKYSELIIKGLLNELIITCIKERIPNKEALLHSQKKNDILYDAINYVKTHLPESPSLEETAQHLSISSSYLSKIFANYLHTPFSKFVLSEKILYAEKLLVNSALSMPEIAIEAGFSSNAYFSDCFKRLTGVSPLKFRKANTPQPD